MLCDCYFPTNCVESNLVQTQKRQLAVRRSKPHSGDSFPALGGSSVAKQRIASGATLCVLLLLWCSTTSAQSRPPSATQQIQPNRSVDVPSLLSKAEAARLDNENRLKTASGKAQLRSEILLAEAEKPLVVTDATMTINYDAPNFAILIDHHRRMREVANDRSSASRRWEVAEKRKVLVIFDGEALYSIDWDRTGNCSGEIYFAFSRQQVLRSAGFPFEHPVHIWREALNLSKIKPSRTRIIPRVSGGFMAIEKMASYDTRFFLFDRFGYDLRRVSTQRLDSGIPIREYTLHWEEADDNVFFLKEFAHTRTRMKENPLTREQDFESETTTSVRFDEIAINADLPSDAFRLATYGVPAGTRFVDKRRRSQRNRGLLEFDGSKFVEVPSDK